MKNVLQHKDIFYRYFKIMGNLHGNHCGCGSTGIGRLAGVAGSVVSFLTGANKNK